MSAGPDREPNRWAVLALLGVAQLMVVLDATIVTIAIPSAQKALHFSTDSRQWIVTAYALAFGSLLLLGGKLGDLFGRKWTLIGGLVGFSIASAIGGLAQSFIVLADAAAVHGYTTAFWWAVGIFGLGFFLAMLILPGRSRHRTATVRAAVARLAIGNCHHAESGEAPSIGTVRGSGALTRLR
ncbi:MAG TPA: MFS transporter [Solirubrobacteraceae bacterium]|jgi:MFS family permease